MDDMLSRAEYDTFIKTRKIPPAIAGVLWSLLDTDGPGEVSKDEFKSALLALQSSRSWSRYCPACEYRNDCAFCQECKSGCPRCSDVSFCASCWNDHPGRQLTMEEQDNQDREPHPFGSTEYMRETVLNEDFKKFAGLDDMLSRAEYDTFIKTKKIPPAIAGVLWSLLDTDGSGEVSKDEFKSALLALQSSRSW